MVSNSVPESRVGVASGINNAVSRTADLVAIAVFGIVMALGAMLAVGSALSAWLFLRIPGLAGNHA